MGTNTINPLRVRVRDILKAADKPMTPRDIADAAGVDIALVRNMISHLICSGAATNIGTFSKALYVHGKKMAPSLPENMRRQPTEAYKPGKIVVRDGAEAAFGLDSIECGKRVKRERGPIIMGSHVPSHAAVGR